MISPFFAPDAYRALLPEELALVVNGCGPAGWRVDLVPDSLLGLCITPECNVHDWMYLQGGDEAARKLADVTLYLNIAAKVLLEGGPLVPLKMVGAMVFYRAVRIAGAEHFGPGVRQ